MSIEDTRFNVLRELLLRIENRILSLEERMITLEQEIKKGKE